MNNCRDMAVTGTVNGQKKESREACQWPDAEIYFLVGGTQTNAVVIGSMLAQYEGVVSARTGYVNGHEAGAIEYTGHKVLDVPQREGKILPGNTERISGDVLGR